MLSYAFFSKNNSVVRAPVANQILRQLLQNVLWGDLDWLLIDFPPGTGDIPLTVTQLTSLNGCIIVTTPQKVATLDVQKTIDMFRKVHVPILGIVENMSYFGEESCTPFGSGGGLRLAETEGIPFLGRLPIDPSISESADVGKLAQLELSAILPLLEQIIRNMETNGGPLHKLSIDQKHLKIEWEDSETSVHSAELLQKNCPCAQCRHVQNVQEGVRLNGFEKVGRYGLRFDFSSGCSYGIYPFELLKELSDV